MSWDTKNSSGKSIDRWRNCSEVAIALQSSGDGGGDPGKSSAKLMPYQTSRTNSLYFVYGGFKQWIGSDSDRGLPCKRDLENRLKNQFLPTAKNWQQAETIGGPDRKVKLNCESLLALAGGGIVTTTTTTSTTSTTRPIKITTTTTTTTTSTTSTTRLIQNSSCGGLKLANLRSQDGDRFVAPSGNDSNPGTVSAPVKSLKRALSLSKAGDLILVRGGTFFDEQTISYSPGTRTSPVTIAAYPGETPVFDGSRVSISDGRGLIQVNASNIVFDGLEIKNSPSRGFSVYLSNNITLQRSNIHDIGTKGFAATGDSIKVLGNTFRNLAMRNRGGTGMRPWPAGISLWFKPGGSLSNGFTFKGNTVSRVWGECISVLHSANNEISDNRISECYSVVLYLDNAQNSKIERNVLDGSSSEFRRVDNNRHAVGISLAVENYSASHRTENITIANNLIKGADRGVSFWSHAANSRSTNTYRNVVTAILYESENQRICLAFCPNLDFSLGNLVHLGETKENYRRKPVVVRVSDVF